MIALLFAAGLWQLANPQQGSFVSRLGTDTVAVETFTRTAGRLQGEVLVRFPQVMRRRYDLRLDSSGRVVSAEVATLIPRPDTTDSVRVRRYDTTRGFSTFVGDAWGPWELVTVQARRSRGDSLRFYYWQAGAPDTGAIDVFRLGRDSLLLRDPNQAHRARVDGDGRLLSVVRPEQQFRVERVPTPWLSQLAASWAQRERRDGPMGPLSTRDTVRSVIGGATLSIDYGRPSRRGREIFGRLVPFGEVWRTGANAATRLTADRAISFGGTVLPAGSYSLWTIPGDSAWALIVNGDPAPGASRDPARDLYRLPMRLARLPRAVEQLTIAIAPEGSGGVIRIQWDLVEASIPFTVSR